MFYCMFYFTCYRCLISDKCRKGEALLVPSADPFIEVSGADLRPTLSIHRM